MAFLRRFAANLSAVNRTAAITRTFCAPASYDTAYFDDLVKKNKVVVFMKGVPDAPRCGFSSAVCKILNMHGVDKFESHDVLEDDRIREGMKEYTSWPTFPQVYFDGEFLGGCDILLEMHQKGDLVEELEKIGIRSALLDEKE